MAWLKNAGLGDDRDVILRQYAEQLALFEAQKGQLETELARRAWDVPEARHLVTIEGIGIYSALLLVFEIGPVERFDNIGKFRACTLARLLGSGKAATTRSSTVNGPHAIGGSRPC